MVYKQAWYTRLYSQIGERYFEYDYTKGTEQEAEFLSALFGQPQNQRILDLGCGPGRHSLALLKRGYAVTGIDISEDFIRLAQKQCQQPQNRFVVADARDLPFMDHFDWVFSLCEGAFGIMENDEEHKRILSNIAHCLKPGGHLFLNALNAAFAFRHPRKDEHFDILDCRVYWKETYLGRDGNEYNEECSVRYYTVPELRLLLQAAGLKLKEVWGTIAGNFSKKSLNQDDFEMLLLAQKAAS
jgi:SAM-dependent methyltransferase